MKRLGIVLLLIALTSAAGFGVAWADPDSSATSPDSIQAG